jgi:hypothetical protein
VAAQGGFDVAAAGALLARQRVRSNTVPDGVSLV